jgi:3'-phosphoadenosine 5'-phosphosulfate (PAPS) 3'-phosphatase
MTKEVLEHNVETGKIIMREATEIELAAWAKADQNEKERADALAQKEIEKSVLLEKLGITEDEARLLLG